MSDPGREGSPTPAPWGELPFEEWGPTRNLLHLAIQLVGKVRMVAGPWLNHSWGVTLYVTTRGFGTGLVPFRKRGFEIDFDLTDSQLIVSTTEGARESVALRPMAVSTLAAELLDALERLRVPVEISMMPNEIEGAIRFDDDHETRAYEPAHAAAIRRALVDAHRVFSDFRAGFVGKASPVHLFWGGFDLAVTRFSGRTAPPHPGGMPNFPLDIAQEAYSHEVTSAGLWMGNDAAPEPLFYSYAYPTPEGLSESSVRPDSAFWFADLGEFVLPYRALVAHPDPDATLSMFLEDTHAAAADLADWARAELELPSDAAHWWRRRPPAREIDAAE